MRCNDFALANAVLRAVPDGHSRKSFHRRAFVNRAKVSTERLQSLSQGKIFLPFSCISNKCLLTLRKQSNKLWTTLHNKTNLSLIWSKPIRQANSVEFFDHTSSGKQATSYFPSSKHTRCSMLQVNFLNECSMTPRQMRNCVHISRASMVKSLTFYQY